VVSLFSLDVYKACFTYFRVQFLMSHNGGRLEPYSSLPRF
jgi:hypothetical protein